MDYLDIAKDLLKDNFADIKYRPEDIIQSPEMLAISKIGHCWEQAELARVLFEQKNIPCKTYFIDTNHGEPGKPWPGHRTHTFLVFQDNGKFYWFEHSWEIYAGIHEYESLEKLLSDIRDKYLEFYERTEKAKARDFRIREYDAIKLPVAWSKFLWHCIDGKPIQIPDRG